MPKNLMKKQNTHSVIYKFSSICDSFRYIANDVANAIGPFAAMGLYKLLSLLKKMIWKPMLIGYWDSGIGITVGLLLYGYRIIR